MMERQPWLQLWPDSFCNVSRIDLFVMNFDVNLHVNYDAILVVSFGGPESREEVIPFLETVLRGKNIPRERLLTVADHYYHFGGKSPINQQTRDLIAALKAELEQHGPRLPIYLGNRNWHPLLPDTLRQMKQDGIRRALGFITSAYSSYSGCRQYREDIARAQSEVGAGAPEVDKLRVFFNHPGFIEATVERVREALHAIPADVRQNVQIIYTAHSIPMSMANTSDYVAQLEEVRGSWFQQRSARRIMFWYIRAAAALRGSLGWSRTFWIICAG